MPIIAIMFPLFSSEIQKNILLNHYLKLKHEIELPKRIFKF